MRGAVRSALARPQRKGPQLLFLPNRDAVENAFMAGVREQARAEDAPIVLEIRTVELGIAETLRHGRVKCLTVIIWRPDGKNEDLQFMMPINSDFDDLLRGAKSLGKVAQKMCAAMAYKMAMGMG